MSDSGKARREAAAASLRKSGVTVSKTGGAYKNPAAIIKSPTAQDQLKTIAAFRKQLQHGT